MSSDENKLGAPNKKLSACPHLINPDFDQENVFSFFTLQKNTNPNFGNSWERFFLQFFT